MGNKIYVPDYTPSKYPCVTYDGNYITAYHSYPSSNRTVNYTRFYQMDHYNSITGSRNFGNTTGIVCLMPNEVTSDFYYRSDLDQILISFFIILIIGFYLPSKIFMRLFKRGRL